MIKKESQGISWLEFEILSDQPLLKHGVFLRKGGVSQDDFGSLNVGFGIGDPIENVRQNIKRIQDTLSLSKIASAKQCHGKDIEEVTAEEKNLVCDVLTTSLPEIGLLIKHADCQAAILYDPMNHVVSCAHVGWRGSVQNVYSEAIQDMIRRYRTDPKNLLVGISPSLGPDSSEFINHRDELPPSFASFQMKKNHFNFWEISRSQLKDCGVLPHHIEIAEIDTYKNTEECFSYRREKNTGRHGTVASLL